MHVPRHDQKQVRACVCMCVWVRVGRSLPRGFVRSFVGEPAVAPRSLAPRSISVCCERRFCTHRGTRSRTMLPAASLVCVHPLFPVLLRAANPGDLRTRRNGCPLECTRGGPTNRVCAGNGICGYDMSSESRFYLLRRVAS